jgi:hypothetical protein
MAGLALNAGFAMAQSDPSSGTTTLPSDAATTSDTSAPNAPAPADLAPASEPVALTVAHIIGTKYIDYCTDGTKVTAYPGDPEVDANLNKPDATTPKCPDGMTWDHTAGMDKYDTPTGDIDVGTYAQQADGSFVIHYAASVYKDATSTSSWPDRIISSKTSPVAPQTTPTLSDGSATTTTGVTSAATSTTAVTSTE